MLIPLIKALIFKNIFLYVVQLQLTVVGLKKCCYFLIMLDIDVFFKLKLVRRQETRDKRQETRLKTDK